MADNNGSSTSNSEGGTGIRLLRSLHTGRHSSRHGCRGPLAKVAEARKARIESVRENRAVWLLLLQHSQKSKEKAERLWAAAKTAQEIASESHARARALQQEASEAVAAADAAQDAAEDAIDHANGAKMLANRDAERCRHVRDLLSTDPTIAPHHRDAIFR